MRMLDIAAQVFVNIRTARVSLHWNRIGLHTECDVFSDMPWCERSVTVSVVTLENAR